MSTPTRTPRPNRRRPSGRGLRTPPFFVRPATRAPPQFPLRPSAGDCFPPQPTTAEPHSRRLRRPGHRGSPSCRAPPVASARAPRSGSPRRAPHTPTTPHHQPPPPVGRPTRTKKATACAVTAERRSGLALDFPLRGRLHRGPSSAPFDSRPAPAGQDIGRTRPPPTGSPIPRGGSSLARRPVVPRSGSTPRQPETAVTSCTTRGGPLACRLERRPPHLAWPLPADPGALNARSPGRRRVAAVRRGPR